MFSGKKKKKGKTDLKEPVVDCIWFYLLVSMGMIGNLCFSETSLE